MHTYYCSRDQRPEGQILQPLCSWHREWLHIGWVRQMLRQVWETGPRSGRSSKENLNVSVRDQLCPAEIGKYNHCQGEFVLAAWKLPEESTWCLEASRRNQPGGPDTVKGWRSGSYMTSCSVKRWAWQRLHPTFAVALTAQTYPLVRRLKISLHARMRKEQSHSRERLLSFYIICGQKSGISHTDEKPSDSSLWYVHDSFPDPRLLQRQDFCMQKASEAGWAYLGFFPVFSNDQKEIQ